MTKLPEAWVDFATRNLPRYTSYPTALRFEPCADDRDARAWAAETDPAAPVSVYVHVPFCRRLCWYCGCHTTIAHRYDRVAALVSTLEREIDLWADALGDHAGARHLHFGGGSPNALNGRDFIRLVARVRDRFALRDDAEIAVELDPGTLNLCFVGALGAAGVTRASLGVQTFDPAVQAKVNRVQPFAEVASAVQRLRAAGVRGINFDLMYGLPDQTPESVADSARRAADLAPDRIAVFGYAHVPWMKKHQTMIRSGDLADVRGRWDQAEAADAALVEAGYVRIGFDHYARPDDAMAAAAASGTLRRNFQGYTTDAAPVLVPLGPSAIGAFERGYVQAASATDVWSAAVNAGRLPVARRLAVTAEDRVRAEVIERLLCDLSVDLGAYGSTTDGRVDLIADAAQELRALAGAGLCEIADARVRIAESARRLSRVVAAAFDRSSVSGSPRHATAV